MFRVTRDALADVAEIGTYVATHNRSAAKRVIRALRETFELLAENPGAGTACDEWLPKGRIDIVAVLHGARDLPVELAARLPSA